MNENGFSWCSSCVMMGDLEITSHFERLSRRPSVLHCASSFSMSSATTWVLLPRVTSSTVASLAMGHSGTSPSFFGNYVHAAVSANLTVHISKITNEKHV